MERIESRQNPLVRRFRELAQGPDSDGAALLDGAHLLEEALRSEVPIELVAVAETIAARETWALAEEAQRAGARVLLVADRVLAAMSPVRQPSGIVSIARCRRATLPECLDRTGAAPAAGSGRLPPLVLILAGVQDAGNVGAIVRAAEGCGATAIVCSAGTADPLGWKALRGAMGSTFRMPIAAQQPIDVVAAELRRRGITMLATVARCGTPLGACDLRGPIAILLGGEGEGLPPDVAAAADDRLTIPMRAPVESLNVAVSAALILFEASRQRELL